MQATVFIDSTFLYDTPHLDWNMPGSSVVDLSNSFGAAFIGLLVSVMLFGLTVVQTWIYFWNYRNRDSRALKFLIAFVTVMDALHTFICAYAVYWYLVLNFGNVENLDYTMWAIDAYVFVSIAISVSVQLFVLLREKSLHSQPKYYRPDRHCSVSHR